MAFTRSGVRFPSAPPPSPSSRPRRPRADGSGVDGPGWPFDGARPGPTFPNRPCADGERAAPLARAAATVGADAAGGRLSFYAAGDFRTPAAAILSAIPRVRLT